MFSSPTPSLGSGILACIVGAISTLTAPAGSSRARGPERNDTPPNRSRDAEEGKARKPGKSGKAAAQAGETVEQGQETRNEEITSTKEGAFTRQGPALNLETPAATGSRLNITPLETPASVARSYPPKHTRTRPAERQSSCHPECRGFTSVGEPRKRRYGSGRTRFRGHGSVMQLYDGTRLYVGAGTVTSPSTPGRPIA